MKSILYLIIVCGLILTPPAIASKYGGAGKRTDKAQKQIHKENQQNFNGVEEGDLERNRERIMEKESKSKEKKLKKMKKSKTSGGMERQREQKSMQEQKELGKGSEQGQKSRENRKKWWKFWGGDEAAQ